VAWFKFLAGGAVGPFSGYRWPAPTGSDRPTDWTTCSGPLEPCRSGVHVCRWADLPFWISEELYTVEVEGAVVEHESFVLARQARLAHRVTSWTQDAAQRFSFDCAWRLRDHTAAALRRTGREDDAARLSGCVTLDDLGRTTRRLDDGDGTDAGRLLAYTADAATYAAGAETTSGWAAAAATTAFIAATAARFAELSGLTGPEATEERLRQGRWIADLALTDG
jgi:hypothetical protein